MSSLPAALPPTTTLADFTSPGLVALRLRARGRAAALAELARGLEREGCVASADRFVALVEKRESLASTDLGGGLAMPHAQDGSLRELRFALGFAEPALAWGAAAPTVKLVVLLAIPTSASNPYLRVIAAIARFIQSKNFWASTQTHRKTALQNRKINIK